MLSFASNRRKVNFPVLHVAMLSIAALNQMTSDGQCFISPQIHKITANVSPAIQSYMEFKPADYDTTTRKYPLIVYIGGTGEMFQQPGGTDQDLCPVLNYSLPWRLNTGQVPKTVLDNTGKPYSYFVVMPFVTQWSQQYSVDPGAMIDYVLIHYPNRIDVSRIYLTGMSRGTDNIMGYVTASATSAKRIAAIVPVANCFPDYTGSGNIALYEQEVANLASGNVHLWGISCAGDRVCTEHYIQNWVNSLDSLKPGYGIFSYSTFACDTAGAGASFHYAWNQAYDAEYRPAASANKDVYEWMIQFSQASLLPILLKDWTARLQGGKVLLEWTTAEELNTKEFLIQRSASGGTFENILTVPAAISSTHEKKYTLVDEHPLPGQNFYRLISRDLDDKDEYFQIRRINVPGHWQEKVIVPNPVSDGLLTIYINNDRSERTSIRLFDMNGRLLRSLEKLIGPGISENVINVAGLQKGTYLLQVTGDQTRTVKKIIIN